MILLDQVAHARQPLIISDRLGSHRMPSAADRGDAVRACPLRLVVDGTALGECEALRRVPRMLSADNESIRIPAPCLWAEWTEADGLRTGALVEADALGRRGSLEIFWERPGVEPDRAQALLLFDLDRRLIDEAPGPDEFGLAPGTHALANNLKFRLDPSWARHLELEGEHAARRALAMIAAGVVPTAETIFALGLLLSAPDIIQTSEVSRAALNRSRQRSGRMPLLDHVQVRLDLSARRAISASGPAGETRGSARLHQVRGHMVRRNGRMFWRKPHLRGCPGQPTPRRTVHLYASARDTEARAGP